ncbi:MAG: pyridoxamine 5'-phosphate oxidase family protein [Terriglobia bacterium]|nr:MAG: pyridoxamine 5'-phosphate oxidase family protein [Terriglobia bacterium]
MDKKRSEIRRHADRSVAEKAVEILAAGRVAHLAFIEDQQPFAIPFGYHFDPRHPDRLFVHGSRASRALHIAASGAPVCVTVTLVDGLVYSKSAMYHSMNYRSVVCFGRGREVTDRETQRQIYEDMVRRYFPGRTAGRDYAPPPDPHLEATLLVEVLIEEASAKAREGGPAGPLDDDDTAPGTRGVVAL